MRPFQIISKSPILNVVAHPFIIRSCRGPRRGDFAEVDDETALLEKAVLYDRKYFELEDQFTSGVWFPVVKSVVAAAEKAQDDYFRVKYLSAEGGEDRETGKSESTAGA